MFWDFLDRTPDFSDLTDVFGLAVGIEPQSDCWLEELGHRMGSGLLVSVWGVIACTVPFLNVQALQQTEYDPQLCQGPGVWVWAIHWTA